MSDFSERPHAYTFVFQLGDRAPAGYGAAPCFYFREDHEHLAGPLRDVRDPDVPNKEAKATFRAIDGFVDRCERRDEIFSDAELRAGAEYVAVRGFRGGGVTLEEVARALERGGFRVVDLGRAAPGDLDELARHLDMASLDVTLDAVQRRTELGLHASRAAEIGLDALTNDTMALTDAIRAAAPAWPARMRDVLLVAVAYAGLRRARETLGLRTDAGKALVAALRAFLDGLPPAEDDVARRRLDAWALRSDAEPHALPRELPRTLDDALALMDTYFPVERGGPAKSARIARLPAALRELYARHDYVGDAIAPSARIASLRAELAALAGMPTRDPHKGDVHPRDLSSPAALLPFGKSPEIVRADGLILEGDLFFLDRALVVDGVLPVLRFARVERACSVEASSLPSFLAAYALREAFGLGLRCDEVDSLIARDRARVLFKAQRRSK